MRYTLHPLNRAFTWQPAREPAVRDGAGLSPAQLEAFERDGCIGVQDVFDAAEVAAMLAAIDPLEAQAEAHLRTRPEGRISISRAGEITFRPHLVLQSPLLARACRHPRLLALCRDLVGPDVRLYWDQSVYKKPGMPEEFPWHQDNGYTFVEPQQYLTCWIALTDATPDNGCPWVVPGLHRLGTLAHEWTTYGYRCLDGVEVEDAVPVPLRAGGVAVFSSLTPHRTGPNLTTATRKAYIVQYAPEGATILRPDGTREPAMAAGRQFPVLRGGQPCDAIPDGAVAGDEIPGGAIPGSEEVA
jgi:ectoine hydroxylase-related dioxygenase (phytanoyl-CoA dioxygenase family)